MNLWDFLSSMGFWQWMGFIIVLYMLINGIGRTFLYGLEILKGKRVSEEDKAKISKHPFE